MWAGIDASQYSRPFVVCSFFDRQAYLFQLFGTEGLLMLHVLLHVRLFVPPGRQQPYTLGKRPS